MFVVVDGTGGDVKSVEARATVGEAPVRSALGTDRTALFTNAPLAML